MIGEFGPGRPLRCCGNVGLRVSESTVKERAEAGPCCGVGRGEGLMEETKGPEGRGTIREDRGSSHLV